MASGAEYKGELTSEQIAAGMTSANHNAAGLLEDATALLGLARWPRAAALAILAIEEQAKEEILFAMATWPGRDPYFWRVFHHSHLEKNPLAYVPYVPADLEHPGARSAWLNAQDPRVIEDLKWQGLYVDCRQDDLGRPIWRRPDTVGEDVARGLVATAARLVERRVVQTEEIEVLKRHLTGVDLSSHDAVNTAHAEYWREVVARGLRAKRVLPRHLGIEWGEDVG